MDISIIVCTRNRAVALSRTLPALSSAVANAPGLKMEIVIVDNGSTDDTPRVIDQWISTTTQKATCLLEMRPGLAAARNAGLQAACGALLVFTDDDCQLAPQYFDDLIRHYAKDRVPTIRGGRVELGAPNDLPFTIKTDPQPAWLTWAVHPGGFLLGCNMVIPRSVFDTTGLFDEHFGAGARFIAAEETDLLFRAYLLGIPVQYVTDMAVRHFHGRKAISDIQRLNFGYHVASGALYMKHRNHPKLLKHFYWDVRKSINELAGGPLFDQDLGLSHRSSVLGNLKGAISYVLCQVVSCKT